MRPPLTPSRTLLPSDLGWLLVQGLAQLLTFLRCQVCELLQDMLIGAGAHAAPINSFTDSSAFRSRKAPRPGSGAVADVPPVSGVRALAGYAHRRWCSCGPH